MTLNLVLNSQKLNSNSKQKYVSMLEEELTAYFGVTLSELQEHTKVMQYVMVCAEVLATLSDSYGHLVDSLYSNSKYQEVDFLKINANSFSWSTQEEDMDAYAQHSKNVTQLSTQQLLENLEKVAGNGNC